MLQTAVLTLLGIHSTKKAEFFVCMSSICWSTWGGSTHQKSKPHPRSLQNYPKSSLWKSSHLLHGHSATENCGHCEVPGAIIIEVYRFYKFSNSSRNAHFYRSESWVLKIMQKLTKVNNNNLPYRGSQAVIIFLASNISFVNSGTVIALGVQYIGFF